MFSRHDNFIFTSYFCIIEILHCETTKNDFFFQKLFISSIIQRQQTTNCTAAIAAHTLFRVAINTGKTEFGC